MIATKMQEVESRRNRLGNMEEHVEEKAERRLRLLLGRLREIEGLAKSFQKRSAEKILHF
jgi:hypothetical protein